MYGVSVCNRGVVTEAAVGSPTGVINDRSTKPAICAPTAPDGHPSPCKRPARVLTDPADRRLTFLRRIAVAVWAIVVVYRTLTAGLAFNRELLLLYIATGLIAASIGRRRKVLMVVRDWLPFALVLVLYDLSRAPPRWSGAHALATSTGGRPLVVLRGDAHGVVARTPQDAAAAVVGGDHQHGLHVVFHRAVRGRRLFVAA
ncbi:PAP2 superfamily domain protein [Mycobacterium xenopi 3993]|nr:PAP2 superfamily domain protein [Mycobacterium xenopi 3993]